MNELLHSLLFLDEKLFHFFNVATANALFDIVMPWITNKKNWYLPGGALWILLMWKGGTKGRTVGILVVLGIILADQISSSVLKPLTARLRPCKTLEGFRLLVHCGSKYGFPSSHASNIAAIGTIFIFYYRKWAAFWIVMIVLIGWSRVYVGVHFPLDVLAGWILGGLISIGLIRIAESKFWIIRGKEPE